MNSALQFLLIQIRDRDDPMQPQEVHSFARALGCNVDQITPFDLLAGVPSRGQLDAHDMVLIGGSGNYSVASEGPWLERALDGMRELVEIEKPTFASCWGFQGISRALGGEVVTDVDRAELGTISVQLTEEGRQDPIFAPLSDEFDTQMGHQDIVDRIPTDAILLASTERVSNQAYWLRDKPIYCTQFHPELDLTSLLERVKAYPQYVERIAGMTIEKFNDSCHETPATQELLSRFVKYVFEC